MEVFRSAALAAAAAVLLAPGLTCAQSTATAAQNPLGPPLPGVCVFARDVALGNSKAGQATDARLRQLGQQVQTELTPESQAIIRENSTIEGLPVAQRQQRSDALQRRATAFNQLQQQRSAQIQQSRAQAVSTILQRMNEVLGPIASTRRCSIIVERGSTYGSNPAMDLTPAVVAALDARLPTLSFDLAPPAAAKR